MRYLTSVLVLTAIFSIGFLSTSVRAEDTTTTKPAETDTSKKEEVAKDVIGVEACDNYIGLFHKCMSSNMPDSAKGPMQQTYTALVNGWKTAKANTTEEVLTKSCTAAYEAAKKSWSAFGCTAE